MSKPILISTISTLTPSLTFSKFELSKAEENFNKNPTKYLEMVPIKFGKTVARFIINGTLSMDGINVSEQFQTHSFPLILDDEDIVYIDQLDKLFELVDGLSEYHQSQFINNDKLWIKCKYSNDKQNYKFQSNVKLNPKRPTDAPFHNNDTCEITCEISAYFNMDLKTYGLSLKPIKVNINNSE